MSISMPSTSAARTTPANAAVMSPIVAAADISIDVSGVGRRPGRRATARET